MNIAVIQLKHTGTEIICDVVEMNEENGAVTIKTPMILHVMNTGENTAQMGLMPFSVCAKDDVFHFALSDILFIADCQDEIAQQYKQHVSPIDLSASGIIS